MSARKRRAAKLVLVSFAGRSRASTQRLKESRWGLEQAGRYGKHWVWDPECWGHRTELLEGGLSDQAGVCGVELAA